MFLYLLVINCDIKIHLEFIELIKLCINNLFVVGLRKILVFILLCPESIGYAAFMNELL